MSNPRDVVIGSFVKGDWVKHPRERVAETFKDLLGADRVDVGEMTTINDRRDGSVQLEIVVKVVYTRKPETPP